MHKITSTIALFLLFCSYPLVSMSDPKYRSFEVSLDYGQPSSNSTLNCNCGEYFSGPVGWRGIKVEDEDNRLAIAAKMFCCPLFCLSAWGACIFNAPALSVYKLLAAYCTKQ